MAKLSLVSPQVVASNVPFHGTIGSQEWVEHTEERVSRLHPPSWNLHIAASRTHQLVSEDDGLTWKVEGTLGLVP